MRMAVRLRYVATADFRRSEATNFWDPEVIPADMRDRLRAGDAICLHSSSGNQVVFVFAPTTTTRADGVEVEVISSARLRLPANRRWDPLMLADYAESVGLELTGLRKLREHLRPNGGSNGTS